MRWQQLIYNQNGINVRNKDILNVNMSSDICVFKSPTFDVSGATKIVSGLTSGSTGVYLIDDNTNTIDLSFNFTGNISTFINQEVSFKYEIYKFNHSEGIFINPGIYKSEEYQYHEFSATSGINVSLLIEDLDIDGEYLIKGYYKHNICTDILSKVGLFNDTSEYKSGLEYGLYNYDYDYYFVACKTADKPIFTKTLGENNRSLGSLIGNTILPEVGSTIIDVNFNVSGDLMVYLNGLMLSENLDYTLTYDSEGRISGINLIDSTLYNDIITLVSVQNGIEQGVKVDNIEINGITSGVTDNQGDAKYYYNTSTLKYELYTELVPFDGNDIIITLNGVTLAPNIDYYQSITNPKRIILEGDLLNGDIVNIIYNAAPTYVGEIYTNKPIISWSIEPPQKNNGYFTLEVSDDETFNNIVSSININYKQNVSSYSTEVIITGSIGTVYYYRVINYKNYETLNGNVISTKSISEIVPIIIMSNSINSY